ncbi:MAG: DDE-type integrase/transposase/recombinase [Patescibacteria group bacterium]|nr:DDE-type integrase/transposase/recombinase [Patescibacteria group bacterium]
MQKRNKTAGVKGLVVVYNEALRFRDMITPSAEERARILAFWQHHGDAAAKEAFKVSRATLFRWQQALKQGNGKLASLNPKSTAPQQKRRRTIPDAVQALILAERKREKVGKEKLARLLKDDNIATLSSSTVGRMLGDLKKKGILPNPKKLTLDAKRDRLIERKPQKPRKKLRSAGWEGKLVKADTIVRFKDGVKRYILTALDLESEFAFAYAYPSHGSKAAADFMALFKSVAPLALEAVQTDNGSEFALHFDGFLDEQGLIHFHTYPRSPKMNAEIERFNRTLSESFIAGRRNLLAYDLQTFNRALMDWLLWYNSRRPHWSLGLISPLRYICNKLTAAESHMCWTSTNI